MSTCPTLPAWPDYALPAPSLNDNLAQQFPDTIARTDFAQGASRQRNLYRSGATTQWITWPWSPVSARIFHGFWTNALNNGVDWFTCCLFNDDCYRTFKVRFVGGQPVKLTRGAGEWIFAAQVETMDDTAPDEYETAGLMLTFGGTLTLDQVVALFHTVVMSLPASL